MIPKYSKFKVEVSGDVIGNATEVTVYYEMPIPIKYIDYSFEIGDIKMVKGLRKSEVVKYDRDRFFKISNGASVNVDDIFLIGHGVFGKKLAILKVDRSRCHGEEGYFYLDLFLDDRDNILYYKYTLDELLTGTYGHYIESIYDGRNISTGKLKYECYSGIMKLLKDNVIWQRKYEIEIDGKKIEISEESYNNLKKSLK